MTKIKCIIRLNSPDTKIELKVKICDRYRYPSEWDRIHPCPEYSYREMG
ncbi:MAG: hypothetical protein HEQ10_19010 [Dolichospermum sp. DEX182a]|nr:hypothetical protein [Dolichospermum sp. DEX182a]